MKNKGLPIGLFNGTVATTDGLYRIQDIDTDKARKYLKENDFISAIGHKATAEIMSDLLEVPIPMNRIQFHQEIGQIVIAFKLNQRPPEGDVLSRAEVEGIGYQLKIIERLE